MNRLRIYSMFVAVVMLPFALSNHNGASLLGIAAVTVFIALTIVGAPSRKDHQS